VFDALGGSSDNRNGAESAEETAVARLQPGQASDDFIRGRLAANVMDGESMLEFGVTDTRADADMGELGESARRCCLGCCH